MASFKDWCGLPSIHGAINYTHIHIQKPTGAFVVNYFSYKSKVHIKQLQAIVDHDKRFCNVFVGLPRSMDDSKVLQLFNFY
jgi:RNase H-fold protein (predicted Holliday junction resolvase)